MHSTILITGATGNVGAEVIRLLAATGPVAGVRDPTASRVLLPAGVAIRSFDFQNPLTYEPALQGIDRIFLMRPPQLSDAKKEFLPFLKYLQEIRIKQVVFLSLLGAEKNSVVPHRKIEDFITELGLPYTFLRPSFFMQNLNTTHRDEIREESEIFVPAGSGRTSFIDIRDIAAIVAKVLTEDGHLGKAYSLTGATALTYSEVAIVLSGELNRQITYSDPSIISFIIRMRRKGLSFGFILVMVAIYTTAKLGYAGTITDTVAMLLGREPISFEQYASDYRSSWMA